MKTYIVVLKVEHATGTQTFRVLAEDALEAENRVYAGEGDFLRDDFEVQEYAKQIVFAKEEQK